MNLAELVENPPLVHCHGTIVWALRREPLQFITDTVKPGWNTVETGLGSSTVAFALKGARHTCVTPGDEEVSRLREYCNHHNISLQNTIFVANGSEFVLHSLGKHDLDFVLIDGGHGFPLPFLDWYYLSMRLRVGGLVMIDDTQLWTGKILREFLLEEPGWCCEVSFPRTSVFRMTAPFRYREWDEQPFVKRKSWWPTHKAQFALVNYLLRKGDFPSLWHAMKKQLRKSWGRS